MSKLNYCSVDKWIVEDLIDSVSDSPSKKSKIIIPKYQRNLVWSSKQKKLFIDSLKSGFPFGALLLYKIGDDNGTTEYSLIDGLQRSTTIMKYVEKPTKFFSIEDIPEEIIQKIIDITSLDQSQREDLIKTISDWIGNLNGFKESDGYSSYNLSNEIINKLDIKLDKNEFDRLVKIIVPFKEEIEKRSDISKIQIPVIIYNGQETNLPEIFGRINSKGTKLSRYQIYAATWSSKSMKIINRDIIKLIKEKYDAMIDEGLQIENYDPTSKDFFTGEFTLFEYLFGLGKLMSNKYPQLFGSYDKAETTESIGFNVCNVCLGLHLSDMDKLPKHFDKVDQEKFEEAVLDSIALVYSQLKPYITLRANKKNTTYTVNPMYHGEYQVVSLIGKVMRSKYDESLQIKSSWNTKKDQILKNIPYHYLYDILREFWRGSGDSKIHDLIQEGSRYENPITKESWINILDEWFNYQLLRKEKSRILIKDTDILFLKYVYTHLLTSYQENSPIDFEIEHIVPVAKLKELCQQQDEGLPISAVSNLALIEKEVNRDKKDKTIYEYFAEQIESEEMTEAQANLEIEKLEKFTFTKKDDLNFTSELDSENYVNFLRSRFEILKNKFLELNNLS